MAIAGVVGYRISIKPRMYTMARDLKSASAFIGIVFALSTVTGVSAGATTFKVNLAGLQFRTGMTTMPAVGIPSSFLAIARKM